MRWHSEHGMGQMWAPKDSPAAGAIRPWPDQEAYEGKDGAANETLAIYFWQSRGTDVHRNFRSRRRAAMAIS